MLAAIQRRIGDPLLRRLVLLGTLGLLNHPAASHAGKAVHTRVCEETTTVGRPMYNIVWKKNPAGRPRVVLGRLARRPNSKDFCWADFSLWSIIFPYNIVAV